MATRNLQFFGTRPETLALIASIAKRLSLYPVLAHDGPQFELRAIPADELEQEAETFLATRVYLSPDFVDVAPLHSNDVVAAKLGWVDFDLPRVHKNQLVLGDFGVKSDWFENDTHQVRQRPELLGLFKQIASAIRPSLKFPVWAWSRSGGKAVAYKDLGYLPDAYKFLEAGGEWVQDIGGGIVFGTEPPKQDSSNF